MGPLIAQLPAEEADSEKNKTCMQLVMQDRYFLSDNRVLRADPQRFGIEKKPLDIVSNNVRGNYYSGRNFDGFT